MPTGRKLCNYCAKISLRSSSREKVLPLVNRIFEGISPLKVRHVLYFNIFVGIDIPTDDGKLRVWSRSTFNRLMKKIGFI